MTAVTISEGLWPRLTEAPLALGRSSRRLTQAGIVMLETAGHARKLWQRGTPVERRIRTRSEHLSWVCENLCALHGINVVVTGARPEGPAVLVSNHLGYLDPLAILSQVPCAALAKHEVGGWPLIGDTLRSLGVLLVERHNAHSGAKALRHALRILRKGVSVLGFPEGTTTTGVGVLPFRRGLFGLASIARVPVVPITLRYSTREGCWVGDELFLPHYVKTTTRRSIGIHVDFHTPIDSTLGGPEELAEASRVVIRKALAFH